jgi:hypothetical protein
MARDKSELVSALAQERLNTTQEALRKPWTSAISGAVSTAAKSLLTIRSWWSSGFEMTFVGALEGLVTFLIGMGLGRIGGAAT